MKALKYLFFLILILFIGAAVYFAVQPNEFEVRRSRIIDANPAVVYNNIIDFKNWESWSPWIEKDPETKIILGEQTKGIGGVYNWVDSKATGSIKTLETSPNESITQEMQYDNHSPSSINWNFKTSQKGKTEVTWTMKSDNLSFLFKIYGIMRGGFDKMIGPSFDRGLEKLDSVVVASTKRYDIDINGVTQHSGGFYIYNTTSCKISEIEAKIKEMMSQVGAYAITHNITMAGPPFVYYHKWDEDNNAVIFSCCVPTTAKVITTDNNNILTGQLEPFKTVETTLKGSYDNLKQAWDKSRAYITENGLEFAENGPMLEVYVTDPMEHPNPADWVTKIFIAVK